VKRRVGALLCLAFAAAAMAAEPPPGPPGMSPIFLRAGAGARYEDETTPYGGFAVGFTPSPYIAFGLGLDFERVNTDYPDASLKSSYSFALNGWGFLPAGRWRPGLHGQAGELSYTYKTFASGQYLDVSETRFFVAAAPGFSYKLSRHIGAGGEGGVRYHPPKGNRDARALYSGGAFVEFYF